MTVASVPAPDPPLAGEKLGPAEAAIYETFVVPRYVKFYGDLLLEMLVHGEDAQVAHLYCRTGYPDRGILLRLPGSHIYGCDPSVHAVELARAKAATMPDATTDYRVAESLPVPLPGAAFSHAIALHPLAAPEQRAALLAEFARLLAPNGQALVAMALRGSFQEVADLLREYALKHEAESGKAIEQAILVRPTVEMIGAELEAAGFNYVDVEVRTHKLEFQSGRDFFEDPIARLMLFPEFRQNLGLEHHDRAFQYVREAIDKYWSDGTFELSINVGCASGRRLPA